MKLTSLVSAVALACTLAACPSKDKDKPRGDTGATRPAPADDRTKQVPGEPAPAAAPAPTAAATPTATALPADCTAYKAMIDRLADCQKLPPATRDGLRSAFAQSWTSWEKASDKAAIAAECKTAAGNLETAAAAACNW